MLRISLGIERRIQEDRESNEEELNTEGKNDELEEENVKGKKVLHSTTQNHIRQTAYL